MKRSDWMIALIVGVLTLGGLGGWYMHHRQWTAAYDRAQFAFAEAWMHRDDPGDRGFSILQRQAAVARDRALTVSPWGNTESIRAMQLDTCVRELDTYRLQATLVAAHRDRGEPSAVEWKGWSDTSEHLHVCLPAGVR